MGGRRRVSSSRVPVIDGNRVGLRLRFMGSRARWGRGGRLVEPSVDRFERCQAGLLTGRLD